MNENTILMVTRSANSLVHSVTVKSKNFSGLNKKNKEPSRSKGEIDDIKVLKPTTHEEFLPKVDLQSTLTVTE